MKEISPGLSFEYGQKTKSYIAIDTLALESRKIIEFQTKRKKFRYRVIYEGEGKDVGRHI